MTYEKIFENVKKALGKAQASAVSGNVAFEFDIVGEGEGKFYIEVKDGAVNIEPYNYYDCDARLYAESETFIKIAKGELKPETAYADGLLKIDGDVGKALELKALIESVPAPKKRGPRAKAAPKAEEPKAKAAAKETAKEVAKEAAAKDGEKPAKKAAAPKKSAAEKPAAKKTAKKAE